MLCLKHHIIVAVALCISSCATLPSSATLQFDEGQVEYVTLGTGSPVVVFESGMGQSMKTWSRVLPRVSEYTRVFAYNRTGYGKSTSRVTPHKAQDIVEQLRRTLSATGNNPPFILVGHSIGGLFMNLFARMYPDEVAGVVFIEASHPDLFDYLRKEDRMWYSFLVWYTFTGRAGYERNILRNVDKEFFRASAFPEIPVIVLTAGNTFSILGSRAVRKKWFDFQTELSLLSTDSQHRIIRKSGHMVHRGKPEEVIKAVREMVDKAATATTGVRLEN